MTRLLAVLLVAAACVPSESADLFTPLQTAAACAPLPKSALPDADDALRIVGAQDVVPRQLYGDRDLVVIAGGTDRGVQLDQRYYIRRKPTGAAPYSNGPRGASTTGWLRIVAVNEATAIGLVEGACDGIVAGDLLQPFSDPVLPTGADRADRSGAPDFSRTGSVLFGDNERMAAGAGDFVVTDMGGSMGATPGSRFAIYRNLQQEGVPLAAVGEAMAVSVEPAYSVMRVTESRGAVFAGDILVPRRP